MIPHDILGRRALVSLYDPLPFFARAFIRLRLAILPLEEVEQEVTLGTVADIGCGYGLLAHYLAHADPRRTVIGIECDPLLVARASLTAVPEERIRFVRGDAETMYIAPSDTIVLCDILHHLSARGQEHILRAAEQALVPGGRIVVKDIESESSIWYYWNLFHDRVLRLSGPTYHRTADEWSVLFCDMGLSVVMVRHFRHFLYHHIIVVAERSLA